MEIEKYRLLDEEYNTAILVGNAAWNNDMRKFWAEDKAPYPESEEYYIRKAIADAAQEKLLRIQGEQVPEDVQGTTEAVIKEVWVDGARAGDEEIVPQLFLERQAERISSLVAPLIDKARQKLLKDIKYYLNCPIRKSDGVLYYQIHVP